MRALIVDHSAPASLRIGEAPDPVAAPGQFLMEVRHTSLNSADLMFAAGAAEGRVLGFDASGVVVAAAADGSGPPVGSRVVAYGDSGGFARVRAVDARDAAVVPDDVDLAQAATLPVAAGTALRALWQAGPLVGLRVLVTGASGGVGTFAVQLAALAGAHVIASVGSEERAKGLADLGAAETTVALDGVSGPLDVVVDTVGGPQLVAAYGMLSPGGSVQSIGWASGQAASFGPGSTLGRREPISITSVYNGSGVSDRPRQLRALLTLLSAGRLKPAVGWRGSWEDIADAAAALRERRLNGKAILDVTD